MEDVQDSYFFEETDPIILADCSIADYHPLRQSSAVNLLKTSIYPPNLFKTDR